ncbi:MAG: undecaprenyl-diphosphate phosphatase [Candidatus Krumholzibacteria bacterium]|nr:undecaprenyl-diphosphate phosphatase [Candidatus Krumholzibacteria bacterium]
MSGDIIIVLVLAVIQGLTEFLPVSSSGHLVIAEALLRTKDPAGAGSIMFEIAVHVGTLGAVIAVYRKKVAALVRTAAGWIFPPLRKNETFRDDSLYVVWIILGSIPAGIVGLLFKARIEGMFDSPGIVSGLLIVTGVMLLLSKGRGGDSPLTWRIVILIGIAQAVAIFPGCSRSGWTIAVALLAGIGFERGAEFSFMLSIPAILGALLLELAGGAAVFTGSSLILLAVGTVTAFVSGLLALKLLIYILRKGSFYRFAWYLVPAGAVLLGYFVIIA